MKWVSIIPPEIKQNFDKSLLSVCTAGFRQTSKTLLKIWLFIEAHLLKRAKNNPKRREKCDKMIKEFMEIYGRIIEKEKELEGKTEHHTQRSFYSFEGLNRTKRKLFQRFNSRATRRVKIWG